VLSSLPPASSVRVCADVVRVAQVISNLLNNAARYTPRGGRIELAWGADGDEVYVRVTDNGIGIPVELQDTIFQMFVQERVASDGSGGLGLGLALARRLIDLHRGRICVSSEGRGHGSTFEIRLPAAGTPNALAPQRRTSEVEPIPRPKRRGTIRTVVVDDNDDARELLTDLLRGRGFEVMSACDGPAGFELIRSAEPDVALLDLGLPGLDGVGVVEMLRAAHPLLKTRLVALTGYGDRSDHERTKRAGFDGHLVKPASADAILALLERVLE
jgi:CheY-like chemotaxis protein